MYGRYCDCTCYVVSVKRLQYLQFDLNQYAAKLCGNLNMTTFVATINSRPVQRISFNIRHVPVLFHVDKFSKNSTSLHTPYHNLVDQFGFGLLQLKIIVWSHMLKF